MGTPSERTLSFDLPGNPYIVGNPLRGEEGFYGRQDMLCWVERSLRHRSNTSLVLFGQPRIGKTSILLQLQQRLTRDSFYPVYFDLMDQAAISLDELLCALAQDMTAMENLPLPSPCEDSDGRTWFRQEYLPALLVQLGESRRPVLLFDEFDVLDHLEKRNLPLDAAATAFFPYLRQLMTEVAQLGYVFVIGRQADDLSRDLQATFKASLSKEVWVLEEEDARELILCAEKQGSLHFAEGAVTRILFLTHGHPYLTQLLCHSLWDKLHRGASGPPFSVKISDVNDAVPVALERGGHGLEWIWRGLAPAEKIYSVALAESVDEGASIAAWRVEQILAEHAPRLRNPAVMRAPETLVKRRILVQDADGGYRFPVELFGIWLRMNKSLESVKDELDAIDPIADVHFKEARTHFGADRWEEASICAQRALGHNPDHFGARHLLGEALLKLGDLKHATEALERAYQMDPYPARTALVQAWKAQAERLGVVDELQEKDLAKAAAAYHRLAALEPTEPRWRDALAHIESEATLVDRFVVGVGALNEQQWSEAQRALADVVYLRPTYQRERFAAELLLEAVKGQPVVSPQTERQLAYASREFAYSLNAQQYGMGYENSIAQCAIHRDGSAVFRREIKLRAHAVVSELSYYTKLPEIPKDAEFDHVNYTNAHSLDSAHRIKPELIRDTKNEVEVRNLIVPPLLPGKELRYEGIEQVHELYALPPVDMSKREPYDYYARDINCPTRRLSIEIVFPPSVEPIQPWAEVWYAVGLSRVPHSAEDEQTKKLLSKRLMGEQHVLSLEIEFPVLGLTYVIAWKPDLLLDHNT